MLDDVTTFRDDIDIDAQANEVVLGGGKYRRTVQARPEAPSEELACAHRRVRLGAQFAAWYERAGEPYVRIEWTSYEPLERIAKD